MRRLYQFNIDAGRLCIQGILQQLLDDIQDRGDDLGAGQQSHRVRWQLLHALQFLAKRGGDISRKVYLFFNYYIFRPEGLEHGALLLLLLTQIFKAKLRSQSGNDRFLVLIGKITPYLGY